MEHSTGGLPHASEEMEQHAKEVFPINIEPEIFAAKDGAGWLNFKFDDFRYSNPELDSWIHAVGKIIRDPVLLKEARNKHLTEQERQDLENYMNDELENIDNK